MLTMKQAREQKGLTKTQTADAIGVSLQTYSKYEQNNASMKYSTFANFCKLVDQKADNIIIDNKRLTINKIIREYLQDNNIDIGLLADKVGTPKNYLEYILYSDDTIDAVLYYKLCTALDVKLEYFLLMVEDVV